MLALCEVTAECVARISRGDIPPKITEQYAGDFNRIKEALNRCIDAVSGLIGEMNRMSAAQAAGDVDAFVDESRFEGAFQDMARGVNDGTRMDVRNLLDGLEVLEAYGKGEFAPVMRRLPGKQAAMNRTFDAIRANLTAVASEVKALGRAAVEGRLSVRVDPARFRGDWKTMVEGVNGTLDAVIGPLHAAASCVEDISRGAIPADT